MTPDSSHRIGLHPSIVLPAYLEPLIRGRRVAVLGDATVGLAEELAQRGARLVHAYDPDPARAAEALAKLAGGRTNQISFAVLAGDLGVRDGAFDAVIIPDLSLFPDAAEVMRRTRKLCAAAGVAVIVAPNARPGAQLLLPAAPDGGAPRAAAPPGYYELYDLVSLQFPKVRMIGQAPFVGYTVADFAPGSEPEVSVDTSLLTASEEPEYFIAVAGERTVTLEAYTVIELPWAEVAAASGGAPDAELRAGVIADREEARLALTEARTRLTLVTVELEKLRDQQQVDGRDAQTRATSAAALSARVVELELESEAREGRLRELEGRSGDNHVRAERLANQIRDMDEELRRQRDRGTRLTKQLEDEKKARTKAEVELGMIRGLSSIPPQNEPGAVPSPRSSGSDAPAAVELVVAQERVAALMIELEETRGRLAEISQDQADTVRRSPVPSIHTGSIAVAPDAKLIHRLNELEGAVNAALREAAEAVAARDAALDRARRAEARAQRILELEGALVTAEAARNDLLERQRELTAQTAADSPRVAELQRRLAESEASRVQAETRLAEARAEQANLERRLADARGQIARLEEQLASARGALGPLESRLARAEERPADLESRLAAAQARATELESRLAVAQSRAADLESRAAAAQARTPVLESRLAAALARTTELEARLEGAEQRPIELEARLSEALARAGEIDGVRLAAEAASAELTVAEAALRERGHTVAALQKDLRESERIGRELLDELTTSRAPDGAQTAPVAVPVAAVEASDLEAQLDRLAQSAARSQADLHAATWRIAQLERELSDAAAPPQASEIQAELEAALAAARDEVASLRRLQG